MSFGGEAFAINLINSYLLPETLHYSKFTDFLGVFPFKTASVIMNHAEVVA